MEDILNNELVIQLAIFGAGMLASLIVLGVNTLITSFKQSENKIDDALIPYLEAIKEALEKEENADSTDTPE